MPTKVLLGENVKKKKLIALISCIVVLALALTGLGSYWYFKQSEETNKARKQCQEEVAKISKPNKTWKKLVGNSFLVTLAQQDSENSKKLASLLAEKAPEPITCNANSAEELGKQSAQAIAASQWYKDEATKIRSLAVSLINEMNEKQDKDKDKDKDKDNKNADKNKDTSVNKKEETKRTPNPVVKHPVKQNNQTKTGKTTPNKNTPKTNKGKTDKNKQNPEKQNPEKQNPEKQNPEKQNPEKQNPEKPKAGKVTTPDPIKKTK
ncbi:ATPase [Gardnerella vaginalis]|uniref:ATPase n=1 Tax=Gardnerella vaginalis TaxID=2702 RepID=UPI0039EE74B7